MRPGSLSKPLSCDPGEAMCQAMASDVEAFLARGGRIQEVAADVMGDPPRKPQTNYGSCPI